MYIDPTNKNVFDHLYKYKRKMIIKMKFCLFFFKEFKLHHQESVYVSNATSSSQACSIQQSSEEQQYRSSQDFISHCGDYESVAHANILSQQQIYSRANHHLVS
ncbi:unnamed protein product [Rotaria socialis]|uniref:Uncharacterized protein n=1 Tax=Rotaria socialis TaxID=392032 RepID=A0A818VDE1_9BILA|nr:unnamed protein product [Rotaria socialis]